MYWLKLYFFGTFGITSKYLVASFGYLSFRLPTNFTLTESYPSRSFDSLHFSASKLLETSLSEVGEALNVSSGLV